MDRDIRRPCLYNDRSGFAIRIKIDLSKLLGAKRLRTTAYHPIANGLVERFHRQLKAAIKSSDQPSHWADILPLILLGIRAALKTDITASAAEMVFGTTLTLPGELITISKDNLPADQSNFVENLKRRMAKLQPVLTRPTSKRSYVDKNIKTYSHVWVRVDSVRKPLQAPYKGPFKVLKRKDKFFILDVHGKSNSVSIDRLKVAHFEEDFELTDNKSRKTEFISPSTYSSTNKTAKEAPQTKPYTTRSGRKVYWPKRYVQVIND